MNLKTILYFIVIPLSIWAIDSLNFEGKFKKIASFKLEFYTSY